MKNRVELEFNSLGVNIGDEIAVDLFGVQGKTKVKFILTKEICMSEYFPYKTPFGEIMNCHIDHIDKQKIEIITPAK